METSCVVIMAESSCGPAEMNRHPGLTREFNLWLNVRMDTSTESAISRAISAIGGLQAVGDLLGVSAQAVHKWAKKGRLPRTEWTGETSYAARMAAATNGAVTREQLLAAKSEAAA